jgi:hypothetical protein
MKHEQSPNSLAAEVESSPEPSASHAHRWMIAPQDGATSSGRCECGAERRFANGFRSNFVTGRATLRRR